MNEHLLPLALGITRIVVYTGYVLMAGTLTFWALVWPEGRKERRLVVLNVVGIGLLSVGTLAAPVIALTLDGQQPGDLATPVQAAAFFVRLAALVAAAFFLLDILRSPLEGWRRALPLLIVAATGLAMVAASNAVGGSWQTVKLVATFGHVIATAAWLGGLIALAAVLIPRENLEELDRLIPRFSIVAAVSVVTLLVTGSLHALAVAGGFGPLWDSSYGLVFAIKVVLFAVMLLMGNHGREYAARAAKQAAQGDVEGLRTSRGVHTLAVVMGAELTMAFVILGATSLLVMVAPEL